MRRSFSKQENSKWKHGQSSFTSLSSWTDQISIWKTANLWRIAYFTKLHSIRFVIFYSYWHSRAVLLNLSLSLVSQKFNSYEKSHFGCLNVFHLKSITLETPQDMLPGTQINCPKINTWPKPWKSYQIALKTITKTTPRLISRTKGDLSKLILIENNSDFISLRQV
jgi:hypothetical protein